MAVAAWLWCCAGVAVRLAWASAALLTDPQYVIRCLDRRLQGMFKARQRSYIATAVALAVGQHVCRAHLAGAQAAAAGTTCTRTCTHCT
jgi:hypothetical protein